MPELLFWIYILGYSFMMLWYVTAPILFLFFLLCRGLIKTCTRVQRVNVLALSITFLIAVPLSWFAMQVLYHMGRIDLL